MSDLDRKPPSVEVRKATPYDGGCSYCIETKDVVVLKIKPFYDNMSQVERFCPDCLDLVSEALFNRAVDNRKI